MALESRMFKAPCWTVMPPVLLLLVRMTRPAPVLLKPPETEPSIVRLVFAAALMLLATVTAKGAEFAVGCSQELWPARLPIVVVLTRYSLGIWNPMGVRLVALPKLTDPVPNGEVMVAPKDGINIPPRLPPKVT